jgi:hypothetical protein
VGAALLGLAAGVPLAARHLPGPTRQFIYIQDLGPRSVVVAWGGPRDAMASASLMLGRRTEVFGALGSHPEDVGRRSPPHGRAEVYVFERRTGRPVPGSPFRTETSNWLRVPLPEADTDYGYELSVDGKPWGDPVYRERDLLHFRSFPSEEMPSPPLAFLVFGDYGTGNEAQRRLAQAMAGLADERERQGRPLRFVLTTGDNLYNRLLGVNTGADDRQFFVKVLGPYQRLLSRVPIYPALGNHDGSESELREDLDSYRDNFFLPPARLPGGAFSSFPGRFYSFGFGRDVRFLCLDSTTNEETLAGLTWVPLTRNETRSEQLEWLQGELATHAGVATKIAYFHHPLFSAARGGAHASPRTALLAPLLEKAGVRLVLSGHHHNFQVSRPHGPAQTRYVVTGAGGEVEDTLHSAEDLHAMAEEGIEVTNRQAQPSFLLIEAEDGEVRVFPYTYDRPDAGYAALELRTAKGREMAAAEVPEPYLRLLSAGAPQAALLRRPQAP